MAVHSVLQELENCADMLKSEPEVTHRLALLKASEDEEDDQARDMCADATSPEPSP